MKKKKIAIIGLGVIGASLGMALVETGNYHVVGVDRDPLTLQIAEETKALTEGTRDCCEGVRGAHVVFLAVPIGEIFKVAEKIKDFVAPSTVITDVGSTKGLIVAKLEEIFSSRFVGGHPMAGSEYAGIRGADRYLFENALYVVTPTPRTDSRALAELEEIVDEIGARSFYLSPQEHDYIVATVSHLPHLLAVSLMNYAGKLASNRPETLLLAAGGFRDVTRIAAGHPSIWRDIYASNREYIINTCRQFREILRKMEDCLEQEDWDALAAALERARQEREKIPLKLRGFLPAVYEVVVTVPDRPGSIAHVTGILGKKGINIIDIEILRVREGDGGTIRLAFATEAEAELALHALREKGIIVKRR